MSASDPSTDSARKEAIAALQRKSNFWRFAGTWAILSVFFVLIWLFTQPEKTVMNFWPIWPIIGMGIGLLFAGLNAFGPRSGQPSESQIQDQMRKMQ